MKTAFIMIFIKDLCHGMKNNSIPFQGMKKMTPSQKYSAPSPPPQASIKWVLPKLV